MILNSRFFLFRQLSIRFAGLSSWTMRTHRIVATASHWQSKSRRGGDRHYRHNTSHSGRLPWASAAGALVPEAAAQAIAGFPALSAFQSITASAADHSCSPSSHIAAGTAAYSARVYATCDACKNSALPKLNTLKILNFTVSASTPCRKFYWHRVAGEIST